MIHRKTIRVRKLVASIMEELCQVAPSEGRDIEFDESVRFDNGMVMDVQVCHGGDDCYWTQGVLYEPSVVFDNHLIEVACTDVGESFVREYRILHDNDEYIVNVEVSE